MNSSPSSSRNKIKEEDTWKTFREIENKYVIIEKVGCGTFRFEKKI
jgi:hypothetical protein